jgi:hypothetical protein
MTGTSSRGGEARGIGTRRRDDKLYNKGGIGSVTETKGVYRDIDRGIGPISGTLDFATGSENYSSSTGRFLLESGFDSTREIYTSLIYSKYRRGTSALVGSVK